MTARLLAAVAALLLVPSAVFAHVTVWPRESRSGAHERYSIRVPNEKQANTISVEVRFPANLKVTALQQISGWTAESLRDSSGMMIGARWTGRLAPQQFTEFGLLAVNPVTAGDLVWTATQVFEDGTRLEWSGPAGSKTPAPHVILKPAEH